MNNCNLIESNIVEQNVISSGGFSIITVGRLLKEKIIIKSVNNNSLLCQEIKLLLTLKSIYFPLFYGIALKSKNTNDSKIIKLVIEQIDGNTLDKFISLKPNNLIKYLILHELCSAITIIHENSLIHKDLKPKNIIIDNTYNTKLLDFGITSKINSTTTEDYGTLSYL